MNNLKAYGFIIRAVCFISIGICLGNFLNIDEKTGGVIFIVAMLIFVVFNFFIENKRKA